MFSIVSTIAEDMTGMRMGMNQIAATQFSQPVNENIFYQPLEEKRENKLITVSDDEDSDNEEEEDSVDEEVSVDEEGSLDEEDSVDEEGSIDSISINNIEDDDLDELSEEEGEQIKVFKLNISKEADDNNDDEEENNIEELHSDNDLEETPIAPISKIDTSELKTISINLEESIEKIDYKKLQLPKLKSIVVEKGLTTASDASKLKKAELLKLLGIE
jgi:hypothetical protein